MKKFARIAASAAIILAIQIPGAALAEGWQTPLPDISQQGIALQDSVESGGPASYIEAAKTVDGKRVISICKTYGEAGCVTEMSTTVSASLILGVCVDSETNCIESVSVYPSKGTRTNAVFVKNVPGPTTNANVAANIPRGSTVSIWSANGVNHDGGNSNYAAWARVRLDVTGGHAVFKSFSAGVTPVNESSSLGMPTPEVRVRTDQNGNQGVEIMNSGSQCVYNYGGLCARAQNFTQDVRVALRLRISNSLTGWLKGRLADPVYSVQRFDQNSNVVDIDATPTMVPMLVAFFTRSDDKDWLRQHFPFILDRFAQSTTGGTSHQPSDSTTGILAVGDLRAKVKDTATGLNSVWSFSSLQNQGPQQSNQSCLSDTTKLLGLVTTNAMAYEGGAPRFEGGQLLYKVAGMHFAPDGKTENIGTYDLVMRSETARCLYGFSSAPISATISVTGGDTQNVATTVVNEKDGWLHLAAYGFTYSDKVITAKLSQLAPVVKKKTVTIQCVNNKSPKTIKTVSGTAPKCPSGFHKK